MVRNPGPIYPIALSRGSNLWLALACVAISVNFIFLEKKVDNHISRFSFLPGSPEPQLYFYSLVLQYPVFPKRLRVRTCAVGFQDQNVKDLNAWDGVGWGVRDRMHQFRWREAPKHVYRLVIFKRSLPLSF